MVERKITSKPAPVEARDEALRLYLGKEMKTEDIVKHINSKYELTLGREAVYAWIRNENWGDIKAEVAIRTNQSIIESEVSRRKSAATQQLQDYQDMLDKAKVDYPSLDWKTAGEAARVVDMAIRGQRAVQAGIIHTEFIQDVFDVIVEVIKDEELLKQVAIKLKTIIAKWDEKTNETPQN